MRRGNAHVVEGCLPWGGGAAKFFWAEIPANLKKHFSRA